MTAPVALTLALCIGICALVYNNYTLRKRVQTAGGAMIRLRERTRLERRTSTYFRMASEFADDGLVIQKLDGTIVWVNPAYCRLLEYPAEELVGRNLLSFIRPPEDALTPQELADFRYDAEDAPFKSLNLRRSMRKSGDIFWNQFSLSFRTAPSGEKFVILVCRDVTPQIEKEIQLKKTTSELTFIASHDELTGVANRAHLMRFLKAALDAADLSKTCVGMLHIDLDKFKEINDTYGHSAGDAILVHVAQSVANKLRSNDLVARIGGDEFVVICPDLNTLDELQKIANALANSIKTPISGDYGNLQVSASIGAAISTAGCNDPEVLLKQSDFALYEVKRSGRGKVAAYDEELHSRHSQEMFRAAELEQAILKSELIFYFQPTMVISTGQISGFEALVRWDHPIEGLIAPDEFLPIAKKLGMMADVDFAAMNAALDLKQTLNNEGFRTITVGINASAEVLSHPDFLLRLQNGLMTRNVHSSEVVIELLETIVFGTDNETNPYAKVINALGEAGFQTLLDDFGVGHAGLAHLAELAISGVKIDRSLVRNMQNDAASAKIVATIFDLCNYLDLYVVAEGVETRAQAATLSQRGGTVMQGYWLSKPMPAEDVLDWLSARQAPTSPVLSSVIAPTAPARYLKAN